MTPNELMDYKWEVRELRAEIEQLRAALLSVVTDVLAYEKVNNLAPNPGRKYCWDSVARAMEALGGTLEQKAVTDGK